MYSLVKMHLMHMKYNYVYIQLCVLCLNDIRVNTQSALVDRRSNSGRSSRWRMQYLKCWKVGPFVLLQPYNT